MINPLTMQSNNERWSCPDGVEAGGVVVAGGGGRNGNPTVKSTPGLGMGILLKAGNVGRSRLGVVVSDLFTIKSAGIIWDQIWNFGCNCIPPSRQSY